ncbi:protein kinase, partial [Kribbella sp. NPDC023855]|uniref:protein kinase domain-containing protein n=1 Tax=Kribbella sp. NPDC023855 TaxID=3154698 RepID=UPI0033FDF0C8
MALEDLSGYSLRRGLGSGSAGTVWLLRDLATGRHAVLKRIPKAAVAAPDDLLADLELVRTIDHPHIARLLEVRESDREWLLFTQYVAAGTLTSLLERRGALSPGELVTLISPLAEGLSALHSRGLTHGHLGIGDIMFDADGRPVITDAGLRTQAPPSTPEADLTALSTITYQAGSDPQTFPPSLFTAPAHTLTHQSLLRAHPLPIHLGFTKDNPTPTTSPTEPPTPTSTPASSPSPSNVTPTPHSETGLAPAATSPTAPTTKTTAPPTSPSAPAVAPTPPDPPATRPASAVAPTPPDPPATRPASAVA